MNNTKWTEIFKEFYYGIECAEDENLSNILIPWTTKTTNGYIYSDTTWTHFGVGMENLKTELRTLKSYLTFRKKAEKENVGLPDLNLHMQFYCGLIL